MKRDSNKDSVAQKMLNILPPSFFLMIFALLTGIIVVQLFYSGRIDFEHADSGIFTAIAILATIFIAIVAWTTLKEQDFKAYQEKYDDLKKEYEHLKNMSKLSLNVARVSKETIDDELEYANLERDLLEARINKLIEDKELTRISRIIWQQDRIDIAFRLRENTYLSNKNHYNALMYCSLSNYMNPNHFTDQTGICSIENLNEFLKVLTEDIRFADNTENSNENHKCWIIAAQRFFKSHTNKNSHLNAALLCLIQALEKPQEYYRRFFIFGTLSIINLDNINNNQSDYYSLFRLNNPIEVFNRIVDRKEIEKVINTGGIDKDTKKDENIEQTFLNQIYSIIFYHMNLYTKNSDSTIKPYELIKRYFEKWKDDFTPRYMSPVQEEYYQFFFIFFQDLLDLIKDDKHAVQLYEKLDFRTVAKRIAFKKVNKSSFFNSYNILEASFAKRHPQKWLKIRLLYLTFYYIFGSDDYKADELLSNNNEIKSVFSQITPNWA